MAAISGYESRRRVTEGTKLLRRKLDSLYLYVPCEKGQIHLIQRLEGGELIFHNHDVEELKCEVNLDMLHTADIRHTGLKMGCAIVYRMLREPKRESIFRELAYSGYYWRDETKVDRNIRDFFDSTSTKSLFFQPINQRSSSRCTVRETISPKLEPPVRFEREANAILNRVWNLTEYNSEKEFRGKYITDKGSPQLRLKWSPTEDVRLGTSGDDVPTVFLGPHWFHSVFFKNMAIFNNKLVTRIFKKNYDNCYTVQLVVNSRGFDLVQKTYRIQIMGSEDVTVDNYVNNATFNMFAYKKYATLKVHGGRMEEVK